MKARQRRDGAWREDLNVLGKIIYRIWRMPAFEVERREKLKKTCSFIKF